jgi:hypothetical protein
VKITASNNGCDWEVKNDNSWIKVVFGQSGRGIGEVKLEITPNPETKDRFGKLTIAGRQYTIWQIPATLTLGDLGEIKHPASIISRTGAISATAGGKAIWIFPNTYINGLPIRVGYSTAAEVAPANPVTTYEETNSIPQLLIPFTQEELSINNSNLGYHIGLMPRSAVDARDGTALIFYEKMKVYGAYNQESLGIGIARVTVSNPTVAARDPGLLFSGAEPRFGFRAVVVGSTLYLYSAESVFYKAWCRVAQAPLAQAENRSAYRFWDGNEWDSNVTQSKPMWGHSLQAPSITFNSFFGKYLAVYFRDQSNQVVYRTSQHPSGPWSNAEAMFEGRQSPTSSLLNGNAQAHPAFASDSDRTIVVSYQQPTGGGYGLYANTRLFRFNFARQEVKVSEFHNQFAGKKVMVALAFGQSNSANSGEIPRRSGENVYHYDNGRLYIAQDPLTPAGGNGGSVWTRLGDKLLAEKMYDAVVIASIGVGGTKVSQWTPGTELHQILLNTIDALARDGLPVTHLLWHQGESDAGEKTSTTDYKARFLAMLSGIRQKGVSAPIYVAVATRCGALISDPAIQRAQIELVNPAAGIYAGPNTDTLDNGYRYDSCHFNDAGLDKHAELWLKQLKP